MAAAGAHPPGGEDPPGAPDRRPSHRCENHPGGGRAHIKHTEGGDFRQATYRAVRQGLRTAQAQGACVLLEPWYDFTLRLPQECVGRALADMPRLWASLSPLSPRAARR